MSENTATELIQEADYETVPAFGYELIREILLPDILGSDSVEILYWAGKKLARKFPLDSMSNVIEFFNKAGWGNLSILHEKKNELQLELSGPLIAKRFQNNESVHFQLEAGFIAQQIEIQKQVIAETFEHPRKRGGRVQFTVKWDRKDPAIS